ncbi:TrbI/VirB10 family protein [Luteimonas sp. 3794]|uniref:TrbI/VirB10 family protein n=1 Tax=Luteimonas sp. 3794 TaxID=2817730 RepID=UPI00285763AC|nr:TrbI/VirB10 family protein [Luteimonas sp. 3794]MDR6991644.1 type IV secretion system protein VirB10 [Luteimonas sp. 3794]
MRGADNPYEARLGQQPDLDADAPVLQAAEVQRLNRRALVFLAGIVVLLGGLAFWVFSAGGQADEGARPRTQPAEQIVIPAAPRDLPELPVASADTREPELPPLPVIDDPRTGSSSGVGEALSGAAFSGSQLPSLLERRMQDVAGNTGSAGMSAMAGGTEGMPGAPGGFGGAEPASVMQAPADGPTSARPLYSPDTLLLRGTYIRCVLQSRVISDFPGYTSCVVTEPVYSVNGRRLLLPRGSKVMGFYNADSVIGDRAGIIWDRITTPTGLDVNMRSPGVDGLGAAGNAGHYTAHWGQRLASALLISTLSDAFKYAAAEHGRPQTTFGNGFVVQNPYESNTASTLERMANMALERNMARPPTVTINQGTVVNVYVARDVDFSAVVR